MSKQHIGFDVPVPNLGGEWAFARKWLLPNPGTLVLMVLLALAVPAIASPRQAPEATSTSTISYQGRLADSAGNPLTGPKNMIFRIYEDPVSGSPLWQEDWVGANHVEVSDGLFNVMLGSINPSLYDSIKGKPELYLGIEVEYDGEMEPRVQLGSVPFSMQAMTVPDGSITTEKIADGAVSSAKLNVDNGIAVNGDITVSGRAAIGTTTQGENAQLTVVGGAILVGATPHRADASIHVSSGFGPFDRLMQMAPTGVSKPGLSLLGSTDASGNLQWWAWGVGSDNVFRFDPGSGGFDGPTVLAITPYGRVGVGTTTPGATLDVIGDFHASGTKSAVVKAGVFGQRKLYAEESAEVRFSDEGMGRLADGIARVELDSIFLETIEGQYLVHVTAYGDASLYVAEVGKDYFVVKAHEGNPDVDFAWRLSATRKGYKGVRLEEAGQ